MVWGIRVPDAADKVGNETGRMNKLSGSGGIVPVLKDERLLKSEQILKEIKLQPGKLNGRKNGHNVFQNGVQIAKGIVQVVKNGGKSEFADELLDCSARAPVQWKEVFGLAKYTYYNWVLGAEPGNYDARLAVEQYKPYFRKRAMLLAEQGGAEERKASQFMMDAKELSLAIARRLISSKKELGADLARLQAEKAEAKGKLDLAEAEKIASIAKFYINKSGFLEGWIGRKFVPFEKYMKVAVPLGGAAAAFIAGATPEIIGGAGIAGWLVLKGLKIALDWHLGVVKNRLPKKEAAAIEDIRIDFNERRGALETDFKQSKKALEAAFGESEEKMAAETRDLHHRLMWKFGYLPAG